MKKLQLSIIGIMTAAAIYFYNSLPQEMPSHWNVRGELDGVTPKPFGVFMFPILAVCMFLLFRLVPSFDPLKKKYVLFRREWEMMQAGFTVFMAYTQFIVFYMAFYPKTNMIPLMFVGIGTLFMFLGNFLSKIRRNYFVGIKLPWTLASDDNWNKTHRYAAWCFVIAGAVTLMEAYVVWYAPVIIFGSLMLAGFLPCIYSYLLFKHQEGKMKFVYAGIVAFAAIVIFLRFSSGEDNWMCVNGQWTAHGHPSAAMPAQPCE